MNEALFIESTKGKKTPLIFDEFGPVKLHAGWLPGSL